MRNKPHLMYVLLIIGGGFFASVDLLAETGQMQQLSASDQIQLDGEDDLTLSEDEFADEQGQIEDVPIEQIRNFVEIFQIVKHNYVDQVSNDELFTQAMQGLVERLDPYSRYLDAEHYQQLMNFTEGEIAEPQLKLQYNVEQQGWQLDQIANNSEYYRQGLRNGQIVERINAVNVQNLDGRTIKNLLTGSLGSVLTLSVKIQDKIQAIDIIRTQKINYDVEPFLTDDRILVLKIKAFQQDTTKQIETFIQTYQQQTTIRGILIDIRDNPGGLLSAAVDLADLFLERGLIVSTKGRIEPIQRFQALPSQTPVPYPVAILQNRFSASAAEVFAAALKEHQRAMILGETSYGKGAVQKIFPLKQGALQLTVSHYYTPKGYLIEGKGVEPDEVINMQGLSHEQQVLHQAVMSFNQILQQY